MLRLAPSHPPLWRTASSMQLGPDGAVRLDDVAPWQEQLLDALTEGIPDAMLLPLARTFGASAEAAERFVAGIGGALAPGPAAPLAVQAELPADMSFAEADALAHGWQAGGLDAVQTTRWRQDAPDPALPMIVVADHLIEPRRAGALLAADIPHLPIVLAGDRVVVGPLVVPGVTACLACLHARRTDADPRWPLVAAQLLGRERVPTDAGLVLEAAVLAARLLRAASTGPVSATALSVTLSCADVRRVWHAHRPHADCLCRSPERTETAAEDGALRDPASRPAPTTTATAFARPA